MWSKTGLVEVGAARAGGAVNRSAWREHRARRETAAAGAQIAGVEELNAGLHAVHQSCSVLDSVLADALQLRVRHSLSSRLN